VEPVGQGLHRRQVVDASGHLQQKSQTFVFLTNMKSFFEQK
jgi:hypothetical protein